MGWVVTPGPDVLAGGARVESPLRTVDFLEAYPDILGRRFTCPSVDSCLDSAGEHTVSPFASRRNPPACCAARWAVVGPAFIQTPPPGCGAELGIDSPQGWRGKGSGSCPFLTGRLVSGLPAAPETAVFTRTRGPPTQGLCTCQPHWPHFCGLWPTAHSPFSALRGSAQQQSARGSVLIVLGHDC